MAKRSVISAEALLLAVLLIGGVGFIPSLFSRATIDPALAPRFTAWAGIIFLLTVRLKVLTFSSICQHYLIAFNTIPGNYLVYAMMANRNLFASVVSKVV